MPSRRSIFVIAALAFITLAVMGNLGGTLRQMHMPGGASGGVGDLASPLTSDAGADRLQRSWRAWDDYVTNVPSDSKVAGYERVRTRPGPVIAAWLIVDSFVLAPLLWLLLWRAGRRRYKAGGRWERWLAAVSILATLYLCADELENVLTALFVFHHWPPFVVLRIVSGFKIGLILASAAPIVLSLLLPGGATEAGSVESFRRLVVRFRVPVVVVAAAVGVLLFLPPGVRPQVVDVVRTWVPGDDMSAFFWAAALLVMLTACIWLAGGVAARVAETDSYSRPVDATYLLLNVDGIVVLLWVTLVLEALGADYAFPLGLVVAGAWTLNLIGIAVSPGPKRRPRESQDSRRALACIVAIPALALGVLVLNSAVLVHLDDAWVITVCIASACFALSFLTTYLLPKVALPSQNAAVGALVVVGLAAVALTGWMLRSLVERSWIIGTFGLIFLGLVIATAAFGLLTLMRRPPNGLLALFGLRRAPVITAVVVIFLLAGAFDSDVGFHNVRSLPNSKVSKETRDARHNADLSSALAHASSVPEVGEKVVPLFFFVSSGGGARAAYWTVLTTNCLFGGQSPPGLVEEMKECGEKAPWRNVFAASGISGGSVGLAMYAAQRAAKKLTVPIDRFFRQGDVDPVIASMLFVDLPNGAIAHDDWPDRAARLEESWEHKLPSMKKGFYKTQLRQGTGEKAVPVPTSPVLLLNGAAIEDGCRVNVSAVDLVDEGPRGDRASTCRSLEQFKRPVKAGKTDKLRPLTASRDVDDYVCGDIALSTAGLLSARFPFVSPTGALKACAGSNARKGQHTFVVDGGYVDSSAASPPEELLDSAVDRVQGDVGDNACVQPVVLQLDNGYDKLTKPVEPARPRELVAPILGKGVATSAHAATARQALAREATRPRCDVGDRLTYMHVYPRARPGIEAPLGWSLSIASRNDLKDQIASRANRSMLCEARRWLRDPGGSCEQPEVVPATASSVAAVGQFQWLWLLLALPFIGAVAYTVVFLRLYRRAMRRSDTR